MKIQILGSGCPTCQSLHQLVQEVIAEQSSTAEVEYLSGADGIQKIIELGVMGSPVLVIDNKVVGTGVLAKEKIEQLINNHNSLEE